MKIATVLLSVGMLLLWTAPTVAMGNKPQPPQADSGGQGGGAVSTANALGNNDAVQQGTGDIGKGIKTFGQWFNADNAKFANTSVPDSKMNQIMQTGDRIIKAGGNIDKAASAAPHVAWIATSAGYAAEGDYKGAAVQAANGAGRTTFVSWAGAAAGAWAGGKAGALAGSFGGPAGAAVGFIAGVGVAYVAGWGWDKTVGQGAEAVHDMILEHDAQSQYGGTGTPGDDQAITTGGGGASWGEEGTPGDDMPITTDIAGDTRDISRSNAQQQARDNIRISRPSGGSRPGGCDGRGGCGR